MSDKRQGILYWLQYLHDDMKHSHKKLKEAGFDAKHLAELNGAAKVVKTWIKGVKESTL